MKNKTLFITQAAAIAAVYVVLTMFIGVFGLASGAIQIRISEALTILPFFMPSAIPGLFVGCFLSNLLTGCDILDVIFGSLATLIGAFGTYYIGKIAKTRDAAKQKRVLYLAPIPPIAANTIIVPFVLAYVYHMEGTIPFFMLTVGIGEVLSCFVLGLVLAFAFKKYLYKFIPDSPDSIL